MLQMKSPLKEAYEENAPKRKTKLCEILSDCWGDAAHNNQQLAHNNYIFLLEQWFKTRDEIITQQRLEIIGEENLSKYFKTIDAIEEAKICFESIDDVIAQKIETTKTGETQCFKIMYGLDMRSLNEKKVAKLINNIVLFLDQEKTFSIVKSISNSIKKHFFEFQDNGVKLFIDEVIQWYFTSVAGAAAMKIDDIMLACNEIRFSVFLQSIKECDIVVGDVFQTAAQRLNFIYAQCLQ